MSYSKRNNTGWALVVLIIFMGALFTSFKSHRKFDKHYVPEDISCDTLANNARYKEIYFVDTVRIEEPISFVTKGNHWVVTSAGTFYKLRKYDDSVLEMEDVFLLENDSWHFPLEILEALNEYNVSYCMEFDELDDNAFSKIYARKYRNPVVFFMFLMSQRYYNTCLCGFDDAPSPFRTGNKQMYYKVLMPYREPSCKR